MEDFLYEDWILMLNVFVSLRILEFVVMEQMVERLLVALIDLLRWAHLVLFACPLLLVMEVIQGQVRIKVV